MLLTGVRDESKVNLLLFTAVKSCMVPNLLILLYIRSQDLVLTGYWVYDSQHPTCCNR